MITDIIVIIILIIVMTMMMKWNLGKVKIKPMLPFSRIRWGSREVCRGIAMCFCLSLLYYLACLIFPPSLPHFWVSINSTHWCYPFSFVLTSAWRCAVAWLPWWPPYCWGDCCPPLYGTYPPIFQLAQNLNNNNNNKRIGLLNENTWFTAQWIMCVFI